MFSTVPDLTRARLPRGPHRLTRETVLASQRGRLIAAMADAVADKGYGATTVADVIARAGVSRRTFYEHFRDKEACFLAAYDTGVELLLETLRGVAGADPLQTARATTRAYLEALAAEPSFARTFMIEVAAAGAAALRRREAVHERFAALLRERALAAGLPEQPAEIYLAAVGATDLLVSRLVAAGRARELPGLEDVVLQVQLSLLAAGTRA